MGFSPQDQGSRERAISPLAPSMQGPSGAALAPHDQAEPFVAIGTQDVEVEHSQTLLTLQATNTCTREGMQEKKKGRKTPSKISTTAKPAVPLLEQPLTSMNGGSPQQTAVSDQQVLSEVKTNGVFRDPGVWDRRGVWVPLLRPTSDDATRAEEEGKLVEDRRSQRREDEVGS